MIGTQFTAIDKPYARSRQLKHIDEALLLPGEKPLVEGKLDLGPNPRKVMQDVETLRHLVSLAKYIVEKGAKRDGMLATANGKRGL
ncbi:hypothetical protein HK104_009721, partial [Borealophlyctis nickersoniae]